MIDNKNRIKVEHVADRSLSIIVLNDLTFNNTNKRVCCKKKSGKTGIKLFTTAQLC